MNTKTQKEIEKKLKTIIDSHDAAFSADLDSEEWEHEKTIVIHQLLSLFSSHAEQVQLDTARKIGQAVVEVGMNVKDLAKPEDWKKAVEQVRLERDKYKEALEDLKLGFDVWVCDCGEKWSETDGANIVNEALSPQTSSAEQGIKGGYIKTNTYIPKPKMNKGKWGTAMGKNPAEQGRKGKE